MTDENADGPDVPDLSPPFLDPETSQAMRDFLYWKPKPRLPARVRGRVPPLSAEVERAVSLAVWAHYGFTEEERICWLDAGLRDHEADLARRLMTQGVKPGELRIPVTGRTALDYLRRGESAAMVYARIRKETG